MQKLTISLFKQLALLVALIVTSSYLFIGVPNGNSLFLLQIGLGILYLFFSVAEFSTKLAKMNLPFDRFFYLPYDVISHKLIRLGAFAIAGGVLWISSSGLMFLAGLLFIIIIADLLVFILKIVQRVYYMSLFANYVLISLEGEKKIFASQIESVEYRYDIFYLKLKDKKTVALETDRLAEGQKQIFTEKFVQWALRNQLEFTVEAKAKLQGMLQ
ncbi:MAG TPA: hypothetical protein VNX01_16600 [Bacteroidia bacterium]|nr:hypothetical protein [Bacteroidia bacterium]